MPRSSLMSYLFLLDTIRAIHHDTSPQFHRSELFIVMPASNHSFFDVYSKLVNEAHPLPTNMTQAEDAVLLLSALLSDLVMVHRVCSTFDLTPIELPTLQNSTSGSPLPVLNPYAPFSVVTETKRMLTQLSRGLDLWYGRFKDFVSEDILALFYFCRLFLSYPEVISLPLVAGYKPAIDSNTSKPTSVTDIVVDGETMRYVWLIVDHVNVEKLPSHMICPVWLPVITYFTALVVWAHLKSSSSLQVSYGTLKVLGLFKMELQRMPWPCCIEMIKNLDDLMQASN